MNNNNRLNGLQSLRGIAALSVLLFHVRGYMWIVSNNHTSVFEIFTGVFSLGATLFFAISGFLMAHLIETGYRNFLVRRFARIYPTFFVAVGLSIFAKVLFLGTVTQPDLARSMSLLPFGVIPYPLDIEWTLVYEVFFYIVCTVFTIGNAKKLFPYFLMVWLVAVFVAKYAYGLQTVITPTIETIPFQFFNMFFIVGALTYYVRNKVTMSRAIAISLLTVISAMIVAWPYLERIHVFAVNELHVFGICCVAILLASLTLGVDKPQSAVIRVLERAGDYSYGLYLIHASVLLIVFTLAMQYLGSTSSIIALIGFATALAAGCAMGALDMRIHTAISACIRRKSLELTPATVAAKT